MHAPQPAVRDLERVTRPRVDETGERVADERPLLDVGLALPRDAGRLHEEAREPDDEERAEDQRILGPRLDADAVGALCVAAGYRPHDADEEHEAGDFGAGRVSLV